MARPSHHSTHERRFGPPHSPAPRPIGHCWNPVKTIYVRVTKREGMASRATWEKAGMSCSGCHATWWEGEPRVESA